MPVVVAVSPTPFDTIGTGVFVLLAVAVSTLLGRVLESSNRRAFLLELEQHRDARTDPLTTLANRRAMQERGRVGDAGAGPRGVEARQTHRGGRVGHPLRPRPFQGHQRSLRSRGRRRRARQGGRGAEGRLARKRRAGPLGGGEEFIAVLPATAATGAREVAERMRLSIEQIAFAGFPDKATISIGVATSQQIDDPADEWDLLIKEADRRLYRAKHDGRNRVVAG